MSETTPEEAIGETSMYEFTDLFLEINSGEFDPDESRTIEGTFPGNKQAAMGYALKAKEIIEEAGASVEREYIGERDVPWDSHRIDIHINK